MNEEWRCRMKQMVGCNFAYAHIKTNTHSYENFAKNSSEFRNIFDENSSKVMSIFFRPLPKIMRSDYTITIRKTKGWKIFNQLRFDPIRFDSSLNHFLILVGKLVSALLITSTKGASANNKMLSVSTKCVFGNTLPAKWSPQRLPLF